VTDVYVESGSKRVFACAFDWPGWCRSGKDEASALAALAAYAPRYAPVARAARIPFKAGGEAFRVREHLRGGATTDFGAPEKVAKRDTKPMARQEADRLAALVGSAWAIFDKVFGSAPASPRHLDRSLRIGPNGGRSRICGDPGNR